MVTASVLGLALSFAAAGSEVVYLRGPRAPLHQGHHDVTFTRDGEAFALRLQRSVRPLVDRPSDDVRIWQITSTLYARHADEIDHVNTLLVRVKGGGARVRLSLSQIRLTRDRYEAAGIELAPDARGQLRALLAAAPGQALSVTLEGRYGAIQGVIEVAPDEVRALAKRYLPSRATRLCRRLLAR